MKTVLLKLLIIFILSYSQSVISQDISQMRVDGDAKLLTGELIDKNITDANGDVCAGLIIKSNLSGLSYDSNNGIVKINRKPGEDLLFLSPNERIVSVFKMDYMPLKIDLNSYGIRLKSGKVWELTITDKADDNLLSVSIVVSPNDATLIIDNKKAEVTRVMHYLGIGYHTIVIQRNGYKVVVDTINVSENNTLFVYELVKIKSSAETDNIRDSYLKNMVFVQGGSFKMGSDDGEVDETPIHSVTLNGFYISKYEVTQTKWKTVMGTNPSYFIGGDLPVENINWFDAIEYCNKLSKNKGLDPVYNINEKVITINWEADGYRLPTEAEWEYAARGGPRSAHYQYSGNDDIDKVAWYNGNSNNRTHDVGTKQPNELGIYDMSGNVWEWCGDWYSNVYYSRSPTDDPKGPIKGSTRVLRGGSWFNADNLCRSTDRIDYDPSSSHISIGFRIVRIP